MFRLHMFERWKRERDREKKSTSLSSSVLRMFAAMTTMIVFDIFNFFSALSKEVLMSLRELLALQERERKNV